MDPDEVDTATPLFSYFHCEMKKGGRGDLQTTNDIGLKQLFYSMPANLVSYFAACVKCLHYE